MRHRIADVRNRWLARPSVRSFLGTIWPFRLIARRQARRLFDISAGFVYSRVLMTCLELDWFAQLRHGPVALAELADKADLNVDAAERLMLAACALDLMEPRGHGQFALGPLGAALIGDEGIAAMATHHRMFYTDMADTLALLRDRSNTQLARYWAYATSDSPASLSPTDVSDYTELMAASQPMIAEQVLATFKFGGFSHLVDVGGGKGAFASAVGARYPSLRLSVLDLPAVVARIP
ncbi:MAG: methyltransferase, partial [Pseudomonadota bacterium]